MIVCYAYLCRLSVENEWLESTRDRALSVDGGPMWFSKMVGIIGDRVGQLRENGEYWMGRMRVVKIINSKLKVVVPACVD
jgi:hypothetical protein